ncbi:MAG: DUF1439 domain-containing protein [Pasteurellaceae bacterium]|nr:DUF1439 domain-containing protein [Pasteurellaceae bacterium]
MKFLATLGLFLLTLSQFAQAGLLSIHEKEINHYLANQLAKKVPLQDRVGLPPFFQLDYRLHQLATQIGRNDENRVEIAGVIDGLLTLKSKNYDIKLTLNLDTIPHYEPEQGALFLKDVRLNQWSISPEKYQRELQPFIAPIAQGIAHLLNRQPVYTLDENQLKEAMVKKFGKRIVVEPGIIRLETSLF